MRSPRSYRAGAALVGLATVLAACSGAPSSAPGNAAPVTADPGVAAARASGSGKALQKDDWPQYHRDAQHNGLSTRMPSVHGADSAKLLHNVKLDGDVYASPVVVHGDTIVATENNTVYAFGPGYRQLWKRHVGAPSPSEQRQCGDIAPLGMTGTPVYSTASGLIYVVAERGGDVRHQLYAMNPRTGHVAWHRGVDLPGVSARDMQQRGALAIAHGRVWVSYGAQAGDCGNYKGRVVGVALDGKGARVAYTPPTKRGGGIWNPAGPTLGPDGDLLVVSANGAAFPGDKYDHTNTVLRIDGKAHLVDSFAPRHWAKFNQQDVGLGSQGVALVGSTWAVLGGKSGQVYVLRRNHLGGIAGEVSVKNICPSYGGAAVQGSTLYLPCTDGVRAVRVDSHGKLHVRWHVSSSIQGSPVIGGGRVWTLDASNGVLYGLDPATGKTRQKVDVGETSRFATPAISGRDILVPTLSGLAVVHTS